MKPMQLRSAILFPLIGFLYLQTLSPAADDLRSLDPKVIFTKLDLDIPGLESVKAKQPTDRLAARTRLPDIVDHLKSAASNPIETGESGDRVTNPNAFQIEPL